MCFGVSINYTAVTECIHCAWADSHDRAAHTHISALFTMRGIKAESQQLWVSPFSPRIQSALLADTTWELLRTASLYSLQCRKLAFLMGGGSRRECATRALFIQYGNEECFSAGISKEDPCCHTAVKSVSCLCWELVIWSHFHELLILPGGSETGQS